MRDHSDTEIAEISAKRLGRGAAQESRQDLFFKHPAVLLVLGFALTGVIGQRLADGWKTREWQNQQQYMFRERALEKKYGLVEELFKATAESSTAAEDALSLFYFTFKPEETRSRRAKWPDASEKWRIASTILSQKLRTYFDDPRVVTSFDEVVRMRRLLGNKITLLLTNSNTPEVAVKKTREEALKKEALKLVNDIADELKKCGHLMAQELRGR